MTPLFWAASLLAFGTSAALLWRGIVAQAEDEKERSTAVWAFLTPVPGGLIMTVGPFGLSPLIFIVPAVIYGYVMLVTAGRPLLILGHVIESVDRESSDKCIGRLIFLIVLSAIIAVGVSDFVNS